MGRTIPADTTAERLTELSELIPIEVIEHPNISPETFSKLALEYPLEAMRNPAIPLWILENPLFWKEIEKECIYYWLIKFSCKLEIKLNMSFALTCAERVVDLWKVANGNKDNDPLCDLMVATKKWIRGEIKDYDLCFIRDHALNYHSQPSPLMNDRVANAAGMAIIQCSYWDFRASSAVDWASDAIGRKAQQEPDGSFYEAKFKEQQWQWNHLCSLLDKGNQ